MILPLSNSLVSHESVCLFVMFVSVRTDSSVCEKFLEMFSRVVFFSSIFPVAKQTSFELNWSPFGILKEDLFAHWLCLFSTTSDLTVACCLAADDWIWWQCSQIRADSELRMRWVSEWNWPGTRPEPEPEIWAPAAGAGADPHYNSSDTDIQW